MKRVELGYCAWNHYGLGRVAQYVGQKIRPRGSGEKRAEDELPSWRSMRSLMVKETALGLRSGSLARKGGTTTRSWSTRTWVSSRIEGVFCAKRSGGNGEKGARLQTRHYKSVKERRQERREGGLKSAAEAEHTPLTEEKKILPGLVQGRRRSQRRGGAEKKKSYKKMRRAPPATLRTSSARPLQKQEKRGQCTVTEPWRRERRGRRCCRPF
jgi:hypothetical protein